MATSAHNVSLVVGRLINPIHIPLRDESKLDLARREFPSLCRISQRRRLILDLFNIYFVMFDLAMKGGDLYP